MPQVEFELSGIQDPILRDVLQSIRDFLREFPLFSGEWKFYEFVFTQGEDNKKIPHRLKFTPKDILQTAIIKDVDSGDASIIWNYELFDSTNLDVTVSGPCTVRAFIGRYEIGGRV